MPPPDPCPSCTSEKTKYYIARQAFRNISSRATIDKVVTVAVGLIFEVKILNSAERIFSNLDFSSATTVQELTRLLTDAGVGWWLTFIGVTLIGIIGLIVMLRIWQSRNQIVNDANDELLRAIQDVRIACADECQAQLPDELR